MLLGRTWNWLLQLSRSRTRQPQIGGCRCQASSCYQALCRGRSGGHQRTGGTPAPACPLQALASEALETVARALVLASPDSTLPRPAVCPAVDLGSLRPAAVLAAISAPGFCQSRPMAKRMMAMTRKIARSSSSCSVRQWCGGAYRRWGLGFVWLISAEMQEVSQLCPVVNLGAWRQRRQAARLPFEDWLILRLPCR